MPNDTADQPGETSSSPGDSRSSLGAKDYGWTEERPTLSSTRLAPIVDQALSRLPKGSRVLDIGCGRGDQALRIARQGFDVCGIEPSPSGVEIARRKCPDARIEVDVADAKLLERLACDPFDAVVSTEVCEHVYDPFEWADACYETLKPGGMLVVSTPFHGYFKNLVISLKNGWDLHWSPLYVGGHIKFFSTKTLSDLLERTGFVDLEFRYTGRFAPLWMSMVCIARRPGD